MSIETLQRLLNEACELLIIFEDSGIASEEQMLKISAIFDEIKYSDKIDEEMSANQESQDWDTFGKNKI